METRNLKTDKIGRFPLAGYRLMLHDSGFSKI